MNKYNSYNLELIEIWSMIIKLTGLHFDISIGLLANPHPVLRCRVLLLIVIVGFRGLPSLLDAF